MHVINAGLELYVDQAVLELVAGPLSAEIADVVTTLSFST